MKFKMISNKSITIGTECHNCSCSYTIKGERSFLSTQMWVHISHVAVVAQYLITLYLYTLIPLLFCSLKFFNTQTHFSDIEHRTYNCLSAVLFAATLWISADSADRSERWRTYQREIRLCCDAKYQESAETKPEHEQTESQGQDSLTDFAQPPG